MIPPLVKFPRNKWSEVEISALVWREMHPPATWRDRPFQPLNKTLSPCLLVQKSRQLLEDGCRQKAA